MLLCLAHLETIYGSRGPRLLRRWALVVVGLPLSSETNYWSCVPRAAMRRDHDGSYAPVLGPRAARLELFLLRAARAGPAPARYASTLRRSPTIAEVK